MPRRKQPEQALQAQVTQFLIRALPTSDSWFTGIPAGGGGRSHGARKKQTGYRPGTPDMLIIHASRPIWLELKCDGRALSENQLCCREDLLRAGCKWALVRSLNDVERALKRFGVPLRASAGGA